MDLDLDFSLHLGNEKISIPKKHASSNLRAPDMQPEVDLHLSLTTGPTESDITSVHLSSTPSQSVADMPLVTGGALHMDEGLSSLRRKTGNSFHPLPLTPSTGVLSPGTSSPDTGTSRITAAKAIAPHGHVPPPSAKALAPHGPDPHATHFLSL